MPKKRYISHIKINPPDYTIKHSPCPHCRRTGNLIYHGYLYGISECRCHQVTRGQRIFCSNRNKRKGCGRTFSCFLAKYIYRSLLSTTTAWEFLKAYRSGLSLEKAYANLNPLCTLSFNTLLRFWKKFTLNTSEIRTYILNNYSQHHDHFKSHIDETIQHIEQCLYHPRLDPLAYYQIQSQTTII